MITVGSSFIDNHWTESSGGRFVAINPTTLEPYAEGKFADEADVDRAVRAAHAAFSAWSALSRDERAAALTRLHAVLVERTDLFVQAMAREIGSPLWFGRALQMGMPIANLKVASDAIVSRFADEKAGSSLVVREPIGVVAAITPWNAPVHQIVAKVGAALAAGCTVVLKPSEIAPVTASLFADAVKDSGIPQGVFNLLFGDGQLGKALVAHPLVNMVSFTGSTAVGKAVAATAAEGVKKVTLELGGKSASILLDESLLDNACAAILRLCFSNSGQICVAHSRFLVPRKLLDKVESRCVAALQDWVIGDPTQEATRLGPVATRRQYERVLHYIGQGIAAGATLIAGGPEPLSDLKGYFVRPTIFSNVTADMTIAREEIFGPVLSIMPYDTVDEAVEIANGLPFGLSGGIWSVDKEAAIAVARRMRTGQVAVNGAPQNFATPFGGYGQSGYGRENGHYGIDEFLTYKAIHGVA
jgi:acyl-CoA reductase-like NAD-dependent aldehyde dehydrogenase